MQADLLRLGLGLGLGLEEAMQADLLHLLWPCLLYLVWLCLLCLLWRYTHTVAAAVQADLAECTRKQKEAAERASEFEKQWVAESKLRKDLHNQLQELVGNLRVYCRVRPALPSEVDKGDICVGVQGSDAVVLRDLPNPNPNPNPNSCPNPNPHPHQVLRDLASERRDEKRFEFTQVYGPASLQEEVFADTEPLMTSVLDGFNVCI